MMHPGTVQFDIIRMWIDKAEECKADYGRFVAEVAPIIEAAREARRLLTDPVYTERLHFVPFRRNRPAYYYLPQPDVDRIGEKLGRFIEAFEKMGADGQHE
jgi:hypothetical protein